MRLGAETPVKLASVSSVSDVIVTVPLAPVPLTVPVLLMVFDVEVRFTLLEEIVPVVFRVPADVRVVLIGAVIVPVVIATPLPVVWN